MLGCILIDAIWVSTLHRVHIMHNFGLPEGCTMLCQSTKARIIEQQRAVPVSKSTCCSPHYILYNCNYEQMPLSCPRQMRFPAQACTPTYAVKIIGTNETLVTIRGKYSSLQTAPKRHGHTTYPACAPTSTIQQHLG